MPDYSFSPQFANLANLQPIQPIDVTRGGALQFQALQPIQVLSSQPELIGQSIAGAVQSIGQGALSGITAKWQEEKDLAKEQRKYAHEMDVANVKEAQRQAEKGEQRGWEWKKMHEQDKLIRERANKSLPSAFSFEDENTPIEGELPSNSETEYQDIDPETGENISKEQAKIDFETQLPETDLSNKSKEKIIKQAKALEDLSPKYLTASIEGIGPIAPIPEVPEKPAMTLQGIDVSFIPKESGKEIAQTRTALRELVSKPKQEISQELGPGLYPVRNQKEANKYLRAPLAPNVQPPKLTKLSTGQYAYEVLPMTQEQIAEKQMKEEESKSKISSRKQYEGQKQERLYQQYITAAQREPSVDLLENPVKGVSRFASEIPEFYQQYKDYLAQAEAARIKGDKKTEVYNRRMVAETVNAIIDSFARLESGKAVTEGQLTMIKKQSIDPLQKFTTDIQSWLRGGVVAPDEQVRSIAKIATSVANEAAEKANFFILGQREKFKEQGVPEKNLPKFYPQDIGLESEAKRTLATLTDDYDVKTQQYDEIKDSKDPKDQYKIDVLKKQIELLEYRIDSLNERISSNELLAKKGKKKQFLGHKEFVDRPTGLRDMYGISPFQQMMQQMQQPVSE